MGWSVVCLSTCTKGSLCLLYSMRMHASRATSTEVAGGTPTCNVLLRVRRMWAGRKGKYYNRPGRLQDGPTLSLAGYLLMPS